MNLPVELNNPGKGIINIKNRDQKYFLWCHVRHINPLIDHPEIIKKTDKKIAEKYFSKIEVKKNICVNMFNWFFQFMFQIKNLKGQWICCF